MTSPDPEVSDGRLVEGCLAGEDWAWTALVGRHSGAVFRMALRSVRRPQDAEDLAQEVFVKVSRMLERFDTRLPLRPWLLQVTRNHVIDQHRAARRERRSTIELDGLPVEPGSAPADQETRAIRRQRADLVRRAIDDLPKALREAVMLRDVEGLDYADIAARLDIPAGTVKSRINRGRLALAASLSGLAEDLA